MIGIVDYGCGNLKSLENALQALDLTFARVASPGELGKCDRLILPGVGHYGHAMSCLQAAALVEPLRNFGKPLLGICLGMQLLFEGSEEAPDRAGLGLLPGVFRKFDPAKGLKIPHMGWSELSFQEKRLAVYFVHSYRLQDAPPDAEIGWSHYGGAFVAAFRKGPLAGFQFHPERSGREGLALLKEALAW